MEENKKKNSILENPIFLNFILLCVNIVFFVMKIIMSILTNSLALQADAFDSLKDIIIVLAALIGLIYAGKKPNKKFPYGYYKMENIISMIISIFIFIVGLNIFYECILGITLYLTGKPEKVIISPFIFGFLLLFLFVSLSMALYLRRIGKKTRSPIIQSEAKEKSLDIFISISVLGSFTASLFEFYLLDPVIGIIIALFIIKGGYDIFVHSTKILLDAVIDFNKRLELIKLVENFPKIKKVESLQVRAYGKYIYLEIDIILNKDFHMEQLRNLKKSLIENIQTKFPEIFKVNVFIQSCQEPGFIKIAVPIMSNKGISAVISEHFGECPFFAFLKVQDGKLLKISVQENKYMKEEKRKGLLIAEWLNNEKIDRIYLKKELNKGPRLIFENNFVDLKVTSSKILKDVLEIESVNIEETMFFA